MKYYYLDKKLKNKDETAMFKTILKTKLRLLYYIAKILPPCPIKENEESGRIFKKYFKFCNKMRKKINQLPAETREYIVLKYLIPVINIFFNKNYVNCAQVALLTCAQRN